MSSGTNARVGSKPKLSRDPCQRQEHHHRDKYGRQQRQDRDHGRHGEFSRRHHRIPKSRPSLPRKFPATAWFHPAPGLPPRRRDYCQRPFQQRTHIRHERGCHQHSRHHRHRSRDHIQSTIYPRNIVGPDFKDSRCAERELEPHCWRSQTQIRLPGARVPNGPPRSMPARARIFESHTRR